MSAFGGKADIVGAVRTRVRKIFDRLNVKEAESATYFLDHVSGPEFKAVLSYLARAA